MANSGDDHPPMPPSRVRIALRKVRTKTMVERRKIDIWLASFRTRVKSSGTHPTDDPAHHRHERFIFGGPPLTNADGEIECNRCGRFIAGNTWTLHFRTCKLNYGRLLTGDGALTFSWRQDQNDQWTCSICQRVLDAGVTRRIRIYHIWRCGMDNGNIRLGWFMMPDALHEVQPKLVPESGPQPKPEVESDPQPVPETQSQPELKPAPDSQPEPEPEPAPGPQPQLKHNRSEGQSQGQSQNFLKRRKTF